jgi:hypothetical protein
MTDSLPPQTEEPALRDRQIRETVEAVERAKRLLAERCEQLRRLLAAMR